MLGRNVRSSVHFQINNDLGIQRCVLENELNLSYEADDQTHLLAISWTVGWAGVGAGHWDGMGYSRWVA